MALPCGQYVAWDTETTGLYNTRARPTKENLSKFDSTRIVSLSAVKFSSRGREIDTFNRIIKPIGYQVGATHIHGITHEYAEEHLYLAIHEPPPHIGVAGGYLRPNLLLEPLSHFCETFLSASGFYYYYARRERITHTFLVSCAF